ncbi:hypothetical protein C8R45DRAFT_832196, partial [Mycena sanguinolenta]
LVVTHASVEEKVEEALKREGKVVCELTVTEDMLNGLGTVHGGCSAFLIDICVIRYFTLSRPTDPNLLTRCSSMALFVFQPELASVSSSMDVVFHSPASIGETLRIVNSTIAVGARAMSARTEAGN